MDQQSVATASEISRMRRTFGTRSGCACGRLGGTSWIQPASMMDDIAMDALRFSLRPREAPDAAAHPGVRYPVSPHVAGMGCAESAPQLHFVLLIMTRIRSGGSARIADQQQGRRPVQIQLAPLVSHFDGGKVAASLSHSTERLASQRPVICSD